MKIGRFSVTGEPRVGVFKGDVVHDVTRSVDSFSSALRRLSGDTPPETSNADAIPLSEISYLPPCDPTTTVFATALNYRSHIDEGYETTAPERPWLFLKLYRSLVGHLEPIRYDTTVTNELDYEAELAAVIGEPARKVSQDDALRYVAGYTILNDTSARDIQRVNIGDVERLDWFSGKALQSSTPVGPFVVAADEISSPEDLHIESRLNGELMQDESTSLMIRGVSELVAFISSRVRLEPGDIIATGTPEGVGIFQDVQLSDGDEIEITIDGIGTLSNSVVEEP